MTYSPFFPRGWKFTAIISFHEGGSVTTVQWSVGDVSDALVAL